MKHSHLRPVIVGAFALFAALLPYITGNLYYLHVATVIGVYWVLIATLNLLVGFTGQLSVGHVGLLAIGAYAFCLLAGGQGWNPFLALLTGGAICAAIGLVLGLPSLRLPGFYFAMATLAFGLIVSELALAEQWLTNARELTTMSGSDSNTLIVPPTKSMMVPPRCARISNVIPRWVARTLSTMRCEQKA
jgi:branched-chain amino acid transport system permease protein